MVKKKGKQRKAQTGPRVRNEFTATEDDCLVEYLADVDPAARLTISTYRDVANEPWGSTHSDESWASRYRRCKPIYDVRIEAFLEAREIEESGPRRKRRRLSSQSADDETFPEPSISFARFQQSAASVTQLDQFLGLSLAIDLLVEKHGVEPEVAYAAWERCGDLRLADKELEVEREDGDDGKDGYNEDDDEAEEERVESSSELEPESEEEDEDRSETQRPVPAPAPTPASGRRRPQRPRGRTHNSFDMDFVPSSVPGEGESGMVQQRVETPPMRPRPPRRKTAAPRSDSESDQQQREPSSPSAPSPSPPHPDIDDDNKELDSEDDDAATALLLLQPSPSILQPQPRRAPVAFTLEGPSSPSPQTQSSQYFPTQPSLFGSHIRDEDEGASGYIPTQTSLFGRGESQYIQTQQSLFGSHVPSHAEGASQYIPTQKYLFGPPQKSLLGPSQYIPQPVMGRAESQYIPTQTSLFGSHIPDSEPQGYIPTQTSLFGRREESQYIPTQKSLFG
ncbi:hypothetical protein C8R46DRAFT_1096171 [Mycena filopes]|nr:hypothetical protein C8R46DRAFT_1096171 [Mycena filopes]